MTAEESPSCEPNVNSAPHTSMPGREVLQFLTAGWMAGRFGGGREQGLPEWYAPRPKEYR